MIAEIHQLRAKPASTNFMCSSCGVDAGCNCGAPLMSKSKRAAEAIAASPHKSNVMIAEEIGVGKETVRRARQSTYPDGQVEDQDEKRIGRDGKERRMPVVAVRKPHEAVIKFCEEPMEFLADFNHRFGVWLAGQPDLGERDKEEIISSLQFCADGMARLAQSLR